MSKYGEITPVGIRPNKKLTMFNMDELEPDERFVYGKRYIPTPTQIGVSMLLPGYTATAGRDNAEYNKKVMDRARWLTKRANQGVTFSARLQVAGGKGLGSSGIELPFVPPEFIVPIIIPENVTYTPDLSKMTNEQRYLFATQVIPNTNGRTRYDEYLNNSGGFRDPGIEEIIRLHNEYLKRREDAHLDTKHPHETDGDIVETSGNEKPISSSSNETKDPPAEGGGYVPPEIPSGKDPVARGPILPAPGQPFQNTPKLNFGISTINAKNLWAIVTQQKGRGSKGDMARDQASVDWMNGYFNQQNNGRLPDVKTIEGIRFINQMRRDYADWAGRGEPPRYTPIWQQRANKASKKTTGGDVELAPITEGGGGDTPYSQLPDDGSSSSSDSSSGGSSSNTEGDGDSLSDSLLKPRKGKVTSYRDYYRKFIRGSKDKVAAARRYFEKFVIGNKNPEDAEEALNEYTKMIDSDDPDDNNAIELEPIPASGSGGIIERPVDGGGPADPGAGDPNDPIARNAADIEAARLQRREAARIALAAASGGGVGGAIGRAIDEALRRLGPTRTAQPDPDPRPDPDPKPYPYPRPRPFPYPPDSDPDDPDKEPGEDDNRSIAQVQKSEKVKAYGYIRPQFYTGGSDLLKLTEREKLEEVTDWDLYDLPLPHAQDFENPLFRQNNRIWASRYGYGLVVPQIRRNKLVDTPRVFSPYVNNPGMQPIMKPQHDQLGFRDPFERGYMNQPMTRESMSSNYVDRQLQEGATFNPDLANMVWRDAGIRPHPTQGLNSAILSQSCNY